MRIAFIGKGGSGKSIISSLFIDYVLKNFFNNLILAIDADLNIHLARYLGFFEIKNDVYLSSHNNINKIREYLRGKSQKIKSINEFLKTTPPSKGCNLIYLDKEDFILKNFALKRNNLYLMIVGTYQKEEIGTACYHVNLSIFENILNFLKDDAGIVVADMVAGIDFFANTLFNQFDIFVLVVEPNIGNLKIYENLKLLAQEAGMYKKVFIVGNKILKETDKDFIINNFEKEKILGFLNFDDYLYNFDFNLGPIDYQKIRPENKEVFKNIYAVLTKNFTDPNLRLKNLIDLHLKYCLKESVKKRFGDLSHQIDYDFKF